MTKVWVGDNASWRSESKRSFHLSFAHFSSHYECLTSFAFSVGCDKWKNLPFSSENLITKFIIIISFPNDPSKLHQTFEKKENFLNCFPNHFNKACFRKIAKLSQARRMKLYVTKIFVLECQIKLLLETRSHSLKLSHSFEDSGSN